jgi:DNA mismatch repair protein MutS2
MDEPSLDLHGLTVAEALRRTQTFLMAEQARGMITVRVITGHGTGALKTAIRGLLRRHPSVASSRSALRSDAATIVVLRPPVRR